MSLRFLKMHGAGNDFVVIDGRGGQDLPDAERCRALADRQRGIGCDQIIFLSPPPSGLDGCVRFFNADGGEAGMCGNGVRCAAALLFDETDKRRVTLQAGARIVTVERRADGLLAAELGPPRLGWAEVPLAREADTRALDLGEAAGPLAKGAAVSMGNPHFVAVVPDADAVDLARFGPAVEHHPLFPERTNVEAVSALPDGRWRVRVWERGAGITLACGSGACAVAAVLRDRGLATLPVRLVMDGGELQVESAGEAMVLIGPARAVYAGIWVDRAVPG